MNDSKSLQNQSSAKSCFTFLDKPVETGEINVPDVTSSVLKRLLAPFSREFAEKVYFNKYQRTLSPPNSSALLIKVNLNNSGVL
jgi:hypothetical protein